MAPPSNRRPGFSRRAQYSVFTGYLLATVGALMGAGLLLLSLYNPSAFAGLRGAASDVASPVGSVGAGSLGRSAGA
jgi:rod shape-determining protein MreC